jgi:2-iminobutanoate/2-iminopropanoate deaminase
MLRGGDGKRHLMWASNAMIEATQLSRRAFAIGTVWAACTGALPLSSTSRASPAAAPTVMPRWLASEDPAFAAGATVGDLTFVAQDAAGPGDLPAGAAAQAERALQNLRRALAAVGQSADDLVFLQVLLTDYAAAPEVGRMLRAEFRPERAPTTCFVGVSGLGPDRLVRMDAVASRNRDRAAVVAEGVPLPLGAPCHAVRVGDLVFVGAVDAPEDTAAPSTIILERLDAVLRAVGLGLKDSFRHWAFLRNMAAASVRDAYGRERTARLDPIFAPEEFPANSRIGSPALGPGVAQRSYALATRGRRQYVESKFARRTPRVFAQSVKVGDWLFVAGQDAVDVAQQTLFVGDLRAQTEQCVRQLQFIMEAASGTIDDIVKTTVYLLAGQDREVFLNAYSEQFRRRLRSPWMPAGLTMTVDALRPDCLVEIDAVAYLGAR